MLLLLVFIFIITLCTISYLYRDMPQIISSSYYPDVQKLTLNKKLLISDLEAYSKSRKWIESTIWEKAKNYDDIHYDESYLNLTPDEPKWRGFILRLNKSLVTDNIYIVPKTTKLMLNIPNPINIVITCLEPYTNIKNTNKNGVFRALIPIVIPEKEYEPRPTLIKSWNEPNFKIQNILGWNKTIDKDTNDMSIDKTTGINIAGNNIDIIDMEKNNELIIFDTNLDYQIWNKTKRNAFILIIDIAK